MILFVLYVFFFQDLPNVVLFFGIIFIIPFLVKKGLEFNTKRGKIRRIISFIGLKIGFPITYSQLKGIKVYRVKSSQVINSRVSTTQISDEAYKAILYYDSNLYYDSKKLSFKSRSLNEEFLESIKELALALNIEVKLMF